MWERACPPSTSLCPVVLTELGVVAPERFPHEPLRTEQLGEEEERPVRVGTLADSAQAPQPISGPSRRLRVSPRPQGPPLSEKPRPTDTRPPPSRQFPRGLNVWWLAAGGRTRVGPWGGG